MNFSTATKQPMPISVYTIWYIGADELTGTDRVPLFRKVLPGLPNLPTCESR